MIEEPLADFLAAHFRHVIAAQADCTDREVVRIVHGDVHEAGIIAAGLAPHVDGESHLFAGSLSLRYAAGQHEDGEC